MSLGDYEETVESAVLFQPFPPSPASAPLQPQLTLEDREAPGERLLPHYSYKGKGEEVGRGLHSGLMQPNHTVCVEEHNSRGLRLERDLQEGDAGVQLPALTLAELQRCACGNPGDCFGEDSWVNFASALWGCREREPGVWCPLVGYRCLNWSFLENLRGLYG